MQTEVRNISSKMDVVNAKVEELAGESSKAMIMFRHESEMFAAMTSVSMPEAEQKMAPRFRSDQRPGWYDRSDHPGGRFHGHLPSSADGRIRQLVASLMTVIILKAADDQSYGA